MPRVAIEHKPAGLPWWAAVLALIALLLIAGLIWYFVSRPGGYSMERSELERSTVSVSAPEQSSDISFAGPYWTKSDEIIVLTN